MTGMNSLIGLEYFGGIPLLLVLDHRGGFGEGDGYWYFPTGKLVEPTLRSLGIPYCIVRSASDVRQALVDAARSVEASRRPVAVLLGAGAA